QQQKARVWELHAAGSLARFARARGQLVDADDALASVLATFSDDGQLPALREARTLLDSAQPGLRSA
ncbi:MAG TPA: hypothetical protein VHN20_11390, partial [Beijerinckiaceae bacterium]|nr:hypothetical protein [Beijerinckiaceae bacterium]